MLTASGRVVDPTALTPDDVSIADIAHHLAFLCRFTGAVRYYWSVAQHSLLVHDLVARRRQTDYRLRLCALLHDATEAYLADVATPLKRALPEYLRLERAAWAAIAERFALPCEIPDEVHRADLVALAIERRDLMPPSPVQWPELDGVVPPREIKLLARMTGPMTARAEFRRRYRELAALIGLEEAA
jgi:hypothetical protein